MSPKGIEVTLMGKIPLRISPMAKNENPNQPSEMLGSQFTQSMDPDQRCLQNVTFDKVSPLAILVQIADFLRDTIFWAIRIGLDRDASHGSS